MMLSNNSLLIRNSRFWTPDSGVLPENSVWIEAGIIKAFGDESLQYAVSKGTPTLDAQGGLFLPGFNDAHLHLIEGGFHLLGINLRDARDEEEFVQRLADRARTLAKGTWITGGYWDHQAWPSRRYPTRELIDRLVPDHPVFVVRLDWHIGVANSLALQLAGITRDTPDPRGGRIERDSVTGEPTGILQDTAHEFVYRVFPQPSPQERQQAARAALDHAARLGVTSVQGQLNAAEIETLSQLEQRGELTLRVSAWQLAQSTPAVRVPTFDFMTTGPLKLFADGSLGAGTAWMCEPYTDRPDFSGLEIHERDQLIEQVVDLDRQGHRLVIHAIGDCGVRSVLDAFEAARKANGTLRRRHRIEHVQVLKENDIYRFAELGVVASIQPTHAIDDMRWIEDRIGDRISDAYRFASLLENNVRVALGTDWTVEPLDPLLTLYASVVRERPEGGPEGGWMPRERVRLKQALTCYTLGSAFAEEQEYRKGCLAPGFLADMILLEHDPFDEDPHQLLNNRVNVTIVDGHVVYDRENRVRYA